MLQQMHIQWRQHRAKDNTISVRLYLRSTKRVSGKVQSLNHGYLGSYRQERIGTPSEVRKLWAQIDAAFERLDDSAVQSEREKLETEIAAKIPRPVFLSKPISYAQGDKRGQLKQSISTTGVPSIPRNNYSLVVIDPPWQYQLREADPTHRNRTDYPNMADQDILNLPINEITAKDAYCMMWVTNNHLPLGFQCLEAWGFQYKSIFTWVKVTKEGLPRIGVGHYGRNCTEHFLVSIKGKPKSFTGLGLTDIPNVIYAPRTVHSRKPEEFFAIADRLGDALEGARIELFARVKRKGWECWGAEVQSTS